MERITPVTFWANMLFCVRIKLLIYECLVVIYSKDIAEITSRLMLSGNVVSLHMCFKMSMVLTLLKSHDERAMSKQSHAKLQVLERKGCEFISKVQSFVSIQN
jgi:hypothetical protein